MLFGKTPWPSRDIKSLVESIYSAPLKFPYDYPIGNQTKNFIKGCLEINESDRLSWEEIFNHPIFENAGDDDEYSKIKFDDKAKNILRDVQEAT